MLGDRVIFKVRDNLARLGFVTAEHEDGTVDLAVLRNATDVTYPLDYAVKSFPRVMYGDHAGQCKKIVDAVLKDLVAEANRELLAERMAKARAQRAVEQKNDG